MDILRLVNQEGSGEGFTARPVIIDDCGELDLASGERIDGGAVDLSDIDDGAVAGAPPHARTRTA